MKFLNVEIPVKNLPELDQGFVPLGLFFKHHQMVAQKPLCIAVERSGGQIGTWECKVCGTPEMAEADASAQITGERPVLLLDDVLSELDEGRRAYLLTRMRERQTFVTSCDDAALLRTDGVICRMDGGVLTRL